MRVLRRLSLFLWKSKKGPVGLQDTTEKLNSARIGTIVEKGFKFLLFKACQGKHSVHQQLFTEAYFVLMFRVSHLLSYGYTRTEWARGSSCCV